MEGSRRPCFRYWYIRQLGEEVQITQKVPQKKALRLLVIYDLTVLSDTEPNVKSTTLHLRPGTHHLKFIVDGDMRASDDLPTAVDFTNHLVNYIEVVADDLQGQRSRRESERAMKVMVPAGVHPPQVLPETVTAQQTQESLDKDEELEEEPEEEIPIGNFGHTVPQFLVDIDREEEDADYQRAANVIADAATPPILPLFLGRSILNGTTPMKDDNSVLNYPNHTVLNHLATSSIKNGVLATSVTTRYKRKVPLFFPFLLFPFY